MSRIISTTVYTLDELPESAKEQARAWYREHALNDEGYQNVFDEFCGTCNILGVDIKMYTVPLLSVGNPQQPVSGSAAFAIRERKPALMAIMPTRRRPYTGSGNTTLKRQSFTG